VFTVLSCKQCGFFYISLRGSGDFPPAPPHHDHWQLELPV
jgi:hypothetical protein